MRHDSEQFDAGSPEPDQLDDWLAAAEFPAVSADSTAKLQQEWRVIWPATQRSARWRWTGRIAVAAVVCLAAGATWQVLHRPGTQTSHVSGTPPQVAVEDSIADSVASNTRVEPVVMATPRGFARAPTALESRMLVAIERQEMKRQALAATAPAPSVSAEPSEAAREPVATVDPKVLQRRAQDENCPESARIEAMVMLVDRADAASIGLFLTIAENPANRLIALKAIDRLEQPPTEQLLARMNDPHIVTRMTAAALVGHINGPETTEKLAKMVIRNQNRREALFALAASDGPEAKAFRARAGRTTELASAVASTLAQTAYQ